MTHTANRAADWQMAQIDLDDEETLLSTIEFCYRELFARHFAQDPMANPQLGIRIRAYRRSDDWRVLLLLTPWMFGRLLLPGQVPTIAVPYSWQVERRRDADYVVLGPRVDFKLLQTNQVAHLAYDRVLGHYLCQPLILNLASYRDADAVFAAWDQVIQTRDENMARFARECPWQAEVSRRELFSRWRSKSVD